LSARPKEKTIGELYILPDAPIQPTNTVSGSNPGAVIFPAFASTVSAYALRSVPEPITTVIRKAAEGVLSQLILTPSVIHESKLAVPLVAPEESTKITLLFWYALLLFDVPTLS
jgi:hypothetical protein